MADVMLYTFAVGELRPYIFSRRMRRAQDRALEFIKQQTGFVGIHPVPEHHATLLLYRTENDAKIARNELLSRGCECGDHIGEVFVDEMYVPDGMK